MHDAEYIRLHGEVLSFVAAGRFADARACFARANALKHDVGDLLSEAVRLHQAGALEEAERCYRRILEKVPAHADSLHMLGVLADQTGRSELAIRLMVRAIVQNASAELYYYNLGVALGKLGRVDEAIDCYRKACALRPDFVEAIHNLAEGLVRLGHLAAAIEQFQTALALRPDFPLAAANLQATLAALCPPEQTTQYVASVL